MSDPQQGDKRPASELLRGAGIDVEQVAKRLCIDICTPSQTLVSAASKPVSEQH